LEVILKHLKRASLVLILLAMLYGAFYQGALFGIRGEHNALLWQALSEGVPVHRLGTRKEQVESYEKERWLPAKQNEGDFAVKEKELRLSYFDQK
jgi:hypothetical protein